MTNPLKPPLQYLILGFIGFCGSQQECVWFNTYVEPGLDLHGVSVPRDTTEGALSRVL